MNQSVNQDHELRLHISTPGGVVFDDLIAVMQIKVHDGYMGVNRNRLPTIQLVQLGRIKIRLLTKDAVKDYLVGSGVMIVEKYLCRVFVEFLIDPKNLADNFYLKQHEEIRNILLHENKAAALNTQTELLLRKEISKLKE